MLQRMKLNKHRFFFTLFLLLQIAYAVRSYPYSRAELAWLGAGVVFAVLYYWFGGVRASPHCRGGSKNGWR
ncbi:MAG: hypothetical protein SWN10_24685 [Pseudomonadota bacterium]|nr:hypothetical protein [Pseudomonadota bacterium]